MRYAAYAPVEGTDGWSVASFMSIKIAKQLGANIAAPIDVCAKTIKHQFECTHSGYGLPFIRTFNR